MGRATFSREVQQKRCTVAVLQFSKGSVYTRKILLYLYINIELNFDIYSSCFYNCNAATLQHESYHFLGKYTQCHKRAMTPYHRITVTFGKINGRRNKGIIFYILYIL